MLLPLWQPHAQLQLVELEWLSCANVRLALLRLDQIDPLVSGNKWYKLEGYIQQAVAEGYKGLISLGGAHSNHLHALAAAGKRWGFPTVGLLRGLQVTTPTVEDLQAFGMQLHWLGYGGYRARNQPDFWQLWKERYPDLLPVLEGGGGVAGTLGCIGLIDNIATELPALGWRDYHEIWTAVGTGTTLAGLVLGERGHHPVIGTLALPANHGAAQQIERVLQQSGWHGRNYSLVEACRGGFAHLDSELVDFMQQFSEVTGITLDPLYTGKMLLALKRAVEQSAIAPGSCVIAVHSGGLQGCRAMQVKMDQLRQV